MAAVEINSCTDFPSVATDVWAAPAGEPLPFSLGSALSASLPVSVSPERSGVDRVRDPGPLSGKATLHLASGREFQKGRARRRAHSHVKFPG